MAQNSSYLIWMAKQCPNRLKAFSSVSKNFWDSDNFEILQNFFDDNSSKLSFRRHFFDGNSSKDDSSREFFFCRLEKKFFHQNFYAEMMVSTFDSPLNFFDESSCYNHEVRWFSVAALKVLRRTRATTGETCPTHPRARATATRPLEVGTCRPCHPLGEVITKNENVFKF